MVMITLCEDLKISSPVSNGFFELRRKTESGLTWMISLEPLFIRLKMKYSWNFSYMRTISPEDGRTETHSLGEDDTPMMCILISKTIEKALGC